MLSKSNFLSLSFNICCSVCVCLSLYACLSLCVSPSVCLSVSLCLYLHVSISLNVIICHPYLHSYIYHSKSQIRIRNRIPNILKVCFGSGSQYQNMTTEILHLIHMLFLFQNVRVRKMGPEMKSVPLCSDEM